MGHFPFNGKTEDDLRIEICNTELVLENTHLSNMAQNFLSKMLSKNPAKRMTAAEALKHPWLRGDDISNEHVAENVLELMRQWKKEMAVSIINS